MLNVAFIPSMNTIFYTLHAECGFHSLDEHHSSALPMQKWCSFLHELRFPLSQFKIMNTILPTSLQSLKTLLCSQSLSFLACILSYSLYLHFTQKKRSHQQMTSLSIIIQQIFSSCQLFHVLLYLRFFCVNELIQELLHNTHHRSSILKIPLKS